MTSNRELAAVLAGLRIFQMVREHGGIVGDRLHEIMDEIGACGGAIEALDPDEIDALCHRLNVPPAANPADPFGATALRALVQYVLLYDRTLNDPRNNGSGDDSRSPTGDDYNALYEFVQLAAGNAGIPWELPAPAPVEAPAATVDHPGRLPLVEALRGVPLDVVIEALNDAFDDDQMEVIGAGIEI